MKKKDLQIPLRTVWRSSDPVVEQFNKNKSLPTEIVGNQRLNSAIISRFFWQKNSVVVEFAHCYLTRKSVHPRNEKPILHKLKKNKNNFMQCNCFVRTLKCFLKKFNVFLPLKTKKKHHQKLLITHFLQYCQSAQIQPKSIKIPQHGTSL